MKCHVAFDTIGKRNEYLNLLPTHRSSASFDRFSSRFSSLSSLEQLDREIRLHASHRIPTFPGHSLHAKRVVLRYSVTSCTSIKRVESCDLSEGYQARLQGHIR